MKLSKSDYKLTWIFFLMMTIWLILKFYTEKHPIAQILFDVPIIILKTVAAFFAINWIIQKYIVRKKKYTIAITLSVLALIITGFFDMLRDYFGSGHTWADLPDWGYLIIHSFYYSAGDVAAPFVLIVGKKYYENQIQLVKAKEKQKESELKLLRSQLSPHFLFNNLNTVDALIDTDPLKAKEYISRLSSLYRYLISTKDMEIVPLTDEIAMANDYFYLIETRFGDAYQFEVSPEYAFAEAYLPTGALQTVIENVVKHNKVINGKAIMTKIKISNEAVTLINTKGDGQQGNTSLGTGLKNLKERYELLLDKHVTIVENTTHYSVTLPLTQLTSLII